MSPEFTINPGDIMIKFTAEENKVAHGPNGVTDAEKRILDELRVNSTYSYVVLAENLKISKKTVAEYIKSLKEKGVIVRIGSNKSGYWQINERMEGKESL